MGKDVVEKKAAEKDETVTIRTVYGGMVDPTNSEWYTGIPKKVIMNPWIQVQIDAGKIEIVKE